MNNQKPKISVTQPTGPIPGSLIRNWRQWKKMGTASNMILRWLKERAPIPFKTLPFPMIFNNKEMSLQHQQYVDQEIKKLLQSQAILAVNHIPTVVSPIGVVPKKNNKFRMIINLRYINIFMEILKF